MSGGSARNVSGGEGTRVRGEGVGDLVFILNTHNGAGVNGEVARAE